MRVQQAQASETQVIDGGNVRQASDAQGVPECFGEPSYKATEEAHALRKPTVRIHL